ncbi:MAG: zf-HC2 domain-containing protein [Elusimicrobiota bacterium]|jgi:predicted anti-sigma-YlaC factor YlaD
MNCSHVQSLLSAYLDGEINPPGADWIQSHLQDCASCRVELRNLKEIKQTIEHIEGPPMPVVLAVHIVERTIEGKLPD